MAEVNEQSQTQSQPQTQQKNNLDDIEVKSQDVALNLMAQFLEVAQKRGAFSIQEASKIYECLKFFKPADSTVNDNSDMVNNVS